MWKKLLCVGDSGQPSPPPSPPPQSPTSATPSASIKPTLPLLAVQPPILAQSITHPSGQFQSESPTESPPTPTPTTTPTPTPTAATTTTTRQSLAPLIAPVPSSSPPCHHLTPPTPIDPPSASSTIRTTSLPFSSSSSLSPNLAFPTTTTTTSSSTPSSTSPTPSQSQPSHHRRTSSTGSSRAYRETLNAYAVDSGDGTRSVNQYRLMGESHLGKGSYATVERATDRETGVEYAIKEFSKRRLRQIAATEATRRQRFSSGGGGRGRGRGRGGRAPAPRRPILGDDDEEGDGEKDTDQGPDNLDLIKTEVAIMKKVDHPNIASVHEVIDVTSDDALLIVLELCAGGPILRISQGEQVEPMKEERAREVMRQLILGIAYLHHNNIVHRDIKPDNCLFLADLHHVKLIDFGISKFTEKDEGEGIDSKGSPAYMAPELLGGASGGGSGASAGGGGEGGAVQQRLDMHGYACDVWSLGVTLYALVAGRLPFDDPDPSILFKSIRESDPQIPTTLSLSLQHLLTSLLTKSPTSRPTIRSLWTDPWVTSDGQDPLTPYEENCISFPEPTQAEVDRALNALRASTFLAMSVVAKLKGMRRRSSSIDPSRDRERSGTGMTSLSSEAEGSEGTKTPLGGGQVVASPMSSPLLGATEFSTATSPPPPSSSSSHAPPATASPAPTPSPTPTPKRPEQQRQPTLSLSPLDAVVDQVDDGPSVPSPLNHDMKEKEKKEEDVETPPITRVEEPLMMSEPEEM
ncbi:kinase-like domain-containing protein [Leucosporidium creatinivorum]|uniref:Kinase-like domain-containing protein n=1 Tax=Leucosporidium creatinivorum TaxID=106004 RepID=A0A1Y2FET2_9BASI|nr:kinase-like domain-containing protein [Leucosporidium creatinivorum]